MASTARKIKLDTAKTKRMRSVTLPISSAGMSPPGPYPGPAWATEERAHSGEANRDRNEPGHDPPRERLGSQGLQPTFLHLPAGIREDQKRGDQRGRHKNRPCMKRSEEAEQNQHNNQDGAQMLRGVVGPQSAALDVHVEIRNDDQRDDDERRNQDARDKRREEVQQLLKAEEIPRRLGWVGSEQRVGKLLERRVPEKRHDHHG